MAKQSGLGDQLFISSVDIGADVSAIGTLATPREVLPATGITQFANARLYGKRDGQAEFSAFFNDEVGGTHEKLKALPRTDVHLMYLRGAGIGNEAVGLVGKQVDYAPTRGDDGSLMFSVAVSANGFGIDWCDQLTSGKQTHAVGASNASIDTLAAANFGFQAYLQVFSIGSGTATVTIEDSANNSTWATLAGGVFANVTAPTVERIQSSSSTATVRRYLRVTTSGVFTNLVFAVAINKNLAERAI